MVTQTIIQQLRLTRAIPEIQRKGRFLVGNKSNDSAKSTLRPVTSSLGVAPPLGIANRINHLATLKLRIWYGVVRVSEYISGHANSSYPTNAPLHPGYTLREMCLCHRIW